MSKWNNIKLGDLNEFRSDTINPVRYESQTFELYSVPAYEAGLPEIVRGCEIGSSKQRVQEGDVLLCKINPRINRVWHVIRHTDHPLIASSEWIVIRSNKADPQYLLWCLRSKSFREKIVLNVTGIGGSLTRAQPKTVAQYEIPLPPVSKQGEIAATLDTVSEILRLRKAQLAELDGLVQSQFVEMFGNITETVPLSYYIKSLSAGRSLAGAVVCENKVLKTGAATYDNFDPSQVKNLPVDYEPLPEHQVRDGDVIISRMNTLELVGASAYVWKAPENTYLPDRLWRAELRENSNPIFIWQVIVQPTMKEALRKIAGGTSGSMKNISKPGLLGLPVKKVEINLQNRFADFVRQVDHSKLAIQQSLNETQRLFDSLMAEYFG